MPVTPTSSVQLLDIIRASGIYTPEKLDQFLAKIPSLPENAQEAAAVLIEHGVISKFQSHLLLQGKYKGFRLGSYVIRDVLGRGGMGAVYLAEHQTLQRKVAIKVLVTGKDSDTKLAQDRFLREGRAAAALDHPNIVRIFDVARHGETPYLVMEYVDGMTLQQLLDRDGPVAYPEAAEYIAQAAAGLQHAYEKGFVHRDIKPANLMRDSEGTIKILDMGLARTYDKDEDKLTEVMDKGAIVGTADYISPEQALNNPIDIRADIYSLGATFFALVTGKPPFDGNTTQKLMQHQLKAPPVLKVLNATLPENLTTVVARMMAKKPEGRYSIPADVIGALHPWLHSSHHVLAGLSRTRLAQTSDIQVALAESGQGGSSMRMSTVSFSNDGPASGFVDQVESTTDTSDGLKASRTAQTPQTAIERTPITPAPVNINRSTEHRKLKEHKRRQKRNRLIACGAAIAVTCGVGLAVLTGSKSADPIVIPGPATSSASVSADDVQTVSPKPTATKPSTTQTPSTPPPVFSPSAKPIFTLNAEGVPVTIKLEGRKVLEGDVSLLPRNVQANAGLTKSEGLVTRGMIDDVPAFKLTAISGTSNCGLVIDPEPAGATPLVRSKSYRVRVEYRGEANARLGVTPVSTSLKPLHSERSFSTGKNEWKTAEMEFFRGTDPVQIMVSTRTLGDKGAIWVRRLEILPLENTPPLTDEGRLLQKLEDDKQKGYSSLYEFPKDDPARKTSTLVMKTGDGRSPLGWTPKAGTAGSQIEYFFDEDKKAFGLRNLAGMGLATLTAPPLTAASGAVRLRCDLQYAGSFGQAKIRFRPVDGSSPFEVLVPKPSADVTTIDQVVDLKGFTSGQFEFVNSETKPDGVIHFRNFSIFEVPYSSVRQPIEGAKLYSLDIASIPEFRVKKLGSRRIEGLAESLPPGIKAQIYRPTAVGEFCREVRQGVPALGVGISNGEASCQLAFELEKEMGVKLVPGQYRIKVEYQTAKDSHGTLDVQTPNPITTSTSKFKSIATLSLPTFETGWKQATVDFIRLDDAPIRFALNPRSVTPGTMLYVRSIEVVELLPPSK